MIYFIQCGENGPIKIGSLVTRSITERLKTLQTSSPYELRVIKVIEGTLNREREIHNWFAHLRIRGEWFKPDLELLDFISLQAALPYTIPTSSDKVPTPYKNEQAKRRAMWNRQR